MNILVLTSVYKDPALGSADKSTDIVNSFVHSWSEQGHKVMVVHNVHRYPKIVHLIPECIRKKMAAKMGFQIAGIDAVREKTYNDIGTDVWKLPILKLIPHGGPAKREINVQVKKIQSILSESKFTPDVMAGHWASPQMEVMHGLLETVHCKSAIVLHGTGYIDNPKFDSQKYLERIDKIGARSKSQAAQVKKLLNLDEMPFVCNSGIPDNYLNQYKLNLAKFDNIAKWKFSYVGRLVEYKNIDVVIKALSSITDVDWEFNIVGEGASEKSLRELVEELNLGSKVKFWGRVPREQVMQILSDTHCFVMVSTNEIFGLVYLEAMAASCITIASKNGGVDGIIINGVNGYLCKEGAIQELSATIKEIVEISNSVLCQIVQAGYETAHEYSDSRVAKKYLELLTK